jgi:hypothetical protein
VTALAARPVAHAVARSTRDVAACQVEGTTGLRAASDDTKPEMKEPANWKAALLRWFGIVVLTLRALSKKALPSFRDP